MNNDVIQVNKPIAPQTVSAFITVDNVSKSFDSKSGPITVLENVSFTVPKNSLTIIFGPSGSGKSTLMNVLSGLEPPSGGTVRIDGQNIYDLNADERSQLRAKSMGIVHQVNYWVKSLSVLENVAMPLYLTGSTKAAAIKSAHESLQLISMDQYAHYNPSVLSGGQQQRVSMARALVAGTEMILADEPTGNLDSKNGQMIIDLLIACQKQLKRTILLVTHNIEYLPLSDKQLYVMDGKVVESSKGQKMPPEILQNLRSEINELTKMNQS